jgi:hypothetical protein
MTGGPADRRSDQQSGGPRTGLLPDCFGTHVPRNDFRVTPSGRPPVRLSAYV